MLLNTFEDFYAMLIQNVFFFSLFAGMLQQRNKAIKCPTAIDANISLRRSLSQKEVFFTFARFLADSAQRQLN